MGKFAMEAAERNTTGDTGLSLPTFEDIKDAANRIAPFATLTPVLRRDSLDQWLGCQLNYKCENLQRVGAFKFRGACNAVWSLSDVAAARGVATHSSGNHGAALALAAKTRGIPAWVVMPEGAVRAKVRSVKAYGGEVRFCAATMAGREGMLEALVKETGASIIHPYNDPAIIAGQGTATLEFLTQNADLDVLITPVGGGGLLSGTLIAGKEIKPGLTVFGAEPEGADDAWRSLETGERVTEQTPDTIADGLRATIGALAFRAFSRQLDGILRVSDAEIIDAMRQFWERSKLLIEPSSAVVIAGIRRYPEFFSGKRVGAILTGGNVDLEQLPWQ